MMKTLITLALLLFLNLNNIGSSTISNTMLSKKINEENIELMEKNDKTILFKFSKNPIKDVKISSDFSYNRKHPIFKTSMLHLGIDISAPIGTLVYSVYNGTIVEMKDSKSAGKYIKIKHNNIYSTSYLHLSKFAENIRIGSKVRKGDVIGKVGNSGWSTGPHLDFRLYFKDTPIDPKLILE
jgi:murein DD-endopeptidase MepM/ murein hydrolase activator NlpD